jgi:hypothetical protein
MKAQEMAYQFRLGAKRIDSNSSQDLSFPQIVAFLNKGMLQLLKKRYGPHNSYRATLEEIQKRIDEWQLLIVAHEEFDLEAEGNSKDRFSFDITQTKAQYLFLLRAAFFGSKDDCKDCKIISKYSSSDDLNVDLDNPNERPNFEWRRALHRQASNKLLVYTDGTFSLSRGEIDYLRYPVKIDLAGYKHFDGSASSDVDCELPIFLHDDIVDEAVMCFDLRLNHPDAEAAAAVAASNE